MGQVMVEDMYYDGERVRRGGGSAGTMEADGRALPVGAGAHRAPVLHVHHVGGLVDLHLTVDLVSGVADPVLLEIDDERAVRARADGPVLDVAAEGLEVVPVPEERRVRETRSEERRVGWRGRGRG